MVLCVSGVNEMNVGGDGKEADIEEDRLFLLSEQNEEFGGLLHIIGKI